MHDEQDTCRICSAPAEPEAPLFHPCKCSGTIRYIHQDCLTTWLAHSKKKSCDVCKYQYSFTKVYSPNMPKQLPFVLFLRRFAHQVLWNLITCLRATMVAVIWLAFLPYVTVWTWRFYFIVGENIAWWINDRPRPPPSPVFHPYYANVTVADDVNRTSSSNMTIITLATSYPVWRALSSDIFTGQIIASLIVLAFLGVFLLREWIMQNARPGVFEDDDVPRDQQGLAADRPNVDAEVAQDGNDAGLDVIEGIAPLAGQSNNVPKETSEMKSLEAPLASASLADLTDNFEGSDDANLADSSLEDRPRHRRKIIHSHEQHGGPRGLRYTRPRSQESGKGKNRATNKSYSRHFSSPSRPYGNSNSDDDLRDGPSSDFKFTFAVDRSPSPSLGDASLSDEPASSHSFSFSPSPSTEHLFAYSRPDLPYPLTPSPISDGSHTSIVNIRRPPLPNATLTSSGKVEVIPNFPGSSSSLPSLESFSNSQVLPSPSLASYHAPEELGNNPGPSSSSTYFDRESPSESSTANNSEDGPLVNLEEYFRERDPADSDEEWEDTADPAEDDAEGDGDDGDHRHRRAEPALPNNDEPQNAPPEQGAQPPEQNEELDGNMDEDMDGALEEAIGMRGPITTVFQNAALMIFVLDTTIGVGIWLPFTIGKTSALLFLEPLRILQLLHVPVRTIRLVTDPFVDFCFFVLRHVVFPLFKPLVRKTTAALSYVLPVFDRFNKAEVHRQAHDIFTYAVDTVISVTASQQEALSGIFSAEGQVDSNLVTSFEKLFELPVFFSLEPHFARLGKSIRLNAVAAKAAWVEMANGDASVNRFFAIVLGYAVVGILVALYLNILNVGSVQNAGRAIRNAIRQQLIVTKVAIFILIELVIFPFGCGVMLDVCSLSLFPNTTVATRLGFFGYAPITAIFYHWLTGTMFMYQFAILLAGCRDIMRPGAMWFIKDPSDQNFHPIRDILDRPTLVQLRKLAISAVMYSVVIACGVGGIVISCRLWGRSLLPLRWNSREPLSGLPVDLLFLHVVMPATLKYLRYRRGVRALTARYWKWAAHQLRLSSYMFGGRHSNEELPSKQSWKSFISILFGGKQGKGNSTPEKHSATSDGSFRRVPAGDNIALPKEIRATIAVNEDGTPLDEASQRLINLQNAEAEKAKRNVKEDYCVVYLPPHFRYRILLFIALLWAVFSVTLVNAVALPIHLGRLAFKSLANKEVHDGYSFVVGFYMLWVCFVLGRTLDRMDKRRQRAGGDEPRAEWAIYLFKRAILWSGKTLWMLFWIGVVIPTLIALVMEVYMVHPLRLIINPNLTLRIRVLESWMLGLLYTKIALASMRFRPETRIDAAVKRMKRAGWRHTDAVEATTEVILPVTAGLLGMLFLPVLLILGLQWLLPSTTISDKSLFLYVYPGIFVLAAITRALKAIRSLGTVWAQAIRDSEFLVEMQLQNLEPPRPQPEPTSPSPSPSTPRDDDDVSASVDLESISSQATNVTITT